MKPRKLQAKKASPGRPDPIELERCRWRIQKGASEPDIADFSDHSRTGKVKPK